MTADNTITLFHAPQSRSAGVRTLLEELGAPYAMQVLNMKIGEQRQPAYLAINPMGKVPAIRHRGQLITEQVAIYIYLADLFAEAGFAPALDDALRGPYLRWMVFYAACFEPAMCDKALKRDPAPLTMSPYGDIDLVVATLETQLKKSAYLLGDKICGADILWGTALGWMLRFELLPNTETFKAYAQKISTRSAARKVTELDAEMAAEHERLKNAGHMGGAAH